jgi:hypothetical protein
LTFFPAAIRGNYRQRRGLAKAILAVGECRVLVEIARAVLRQPGDNQLGFFSIAANRLGDGPQCPGYLGNISPLDFDFSEVKTEQLVFGTETKRGLFAVNQALVRR